MGAAPRTHCSGFYNQRRGVLSRKKVKKLKTDIMYKRIKKYTTNIDRNTSYEGETIETKIRRIVNNKEPIKDGAPLVFTERKDGVKPEYDIRTDRWDIAIDAMDKVSKTHKAKREERHKPKIDAEEAIANMKKEG